MNAYEARRNSPEVRAKVERVLAAQNALLIRAAAVLKELSDEMRVLSGAEGYQQSSYSQPIYDRCFDKVASAYYSVERDAEFMKGLGSETYIGNMAAGSMGEYLENINMDARFRGRA